MIQNNDLKAILLWDGFFKLKFEFLVYRYINIP